MDNEREVRLDIYTIILLICMTLAQCSISDDVERIADAAERAYPPQQEVNNDAH